MDGPRDEPSPAGCYVAHSTVQYSTAQAADGSKGSERALEDQERKGVISQVGAGGADGSGAKGRSEI